jgi:acetyl esterase/lipase
MKRRNLFCFWLLSLLLGSLSASAAEPARVLDLWPGTPPGETGDLGKELDTTKSTDRPVAGKQVIRLGNVAKPTITIFRPASGKDTGAAVLVCPGGGYRILAMDLEGTEICEWLNSLGVTGVLLKYRVPKRDGDDSHTLPLQDAQRALGLVRAHAKEWGLDAKRIGVVGFSAGGHLAALLCNDCEQRRYAKVDDADAQNCRPDFAMLVYPAYLVAKDTDQIAPDLKITANTPPTFIAMAADDPVRVENALGYALALRKAKVPVEVHVYPTGGHGYGLRPDREHPVTTWPDRAGEWLRGQGVLRVRE